MTYKSILLHPDIDGHVAPVIKLAVDLAKRLDARLIGLSAADVPLPLVIAEGWRSMVRSWLVSGRTSSGALTSCAKNSRDLLAQQWTKNGAEPWAIRPVC